MNSENQLLYDKEIAPLVSELKSKCRQFNMPMFVTVCIDAKEVMHDKENNALKTNVKKCVSPEYKNSFVNDMVSPYSCGMNVQPDYVAECVKIINGFHAVASAPTKIKIKDMFGGELDETDEFNETEEE